MKEVEIERRQSEDQRRGRPKLVLTRHVSMLLLMFETRGEVQVGRLGCRL